VKLSAQKLLLIGLVLSVLGLLVWAFLPSPIEVDLGRVERGSLQVTVDHEGKTRVRERYVVFSPLAGRLLRIELHPGDTIAAGKTVLAVIEPSEPELLDARSIAQAVARVKAAEAAKERALPNLRSARASHELAETNLARVQKLSERRAASHQELDDAEHRLRVAAEEVKSAQFAAQIAEFELELAQAALVRTRPTESGVPDTGRFEIRAPIDGRILRVFQESEAAISAGIRLLEVGDPTDLEVEVDVLSSDAVKISPGAKAILEHWGGDGSLTGRVRLVEPSAFTKISALGVEEQRVNVVIDIIDPPEKRKALGDAFRVEARIVIWEGDDVLKVPAGALFHRADRWAVYVAVGGRARLRLVRAGRSDGLETQVLEGLSETDQVVIHPSDRVKEGVSIEVR
jgi:HlyD family secretion protein